MREDKLKQKIRENQDFLESEVPSERVWRDIRAELHPEEEGNTGRRISWLAAASIALIIGLGAIWLLRSPNTIGQSMTAQGNEDDSSMPDEMRETEQFYAGQVEYRMGQLSKYDVDADLKEEMDFLTEEFELLKQEMGQGLDNSKVVEAMIENYRLRLDLLEDLLDALAPKGEMNSNDNETENEVEHEI